MKKTDKIYVAGHRGLVGSAIIRKLLESNFYSIVTRSHNELDLTRQTDVEAFFHKEHPKYVFLAAARVGGIYANSTYPAQFIYENILIQSNVIHSAYLHGVKKLLFYGSSCSYPRDCPQPMQGGHLLSGFLEPTNEPYAVAKIAGIKMCQAYNRQYVLFRQTPMVLTTISISSILMSYRR
jgi:GDP-L-fucose synthase